MTVQAQTYGNDSLLRNALKGNAVFSTISGLLFTLASSSVAEFIGIADASIFGLVESATFILIIGIGLLLFAGSLLFTATREQVHRSSAWQAILGDFAWVILSYIILVTGAIPFSNTGSWAVLIIADIVLVFGILQWVGLRRMRG